MIVLGLDPGLGTTGWGLVHAEGNRLRHVANGQLRTAPGGSLARRLSHLDSMLAAIIADHRPDAAAVEEVFVNTNPQSTLKLGQARGVVLLAVARAGIEPGEYAARLVKKALVGTGGADKAQVQAMVARAIRPDYALGAHTASLGLTFGQDASLLPPALRSGVFVGQHGSWNRSVRSGYKVIFVPFVDGRPAGPPQDILTGFLNAQGQAQGRPVGVQIDRQGALLVADEVGNVIWRVSGA